LQDHKQGEWQADWNVIFDLLTGPMLVGGYVPVWKFNTDGRDGAINVGKEVGIGNGQLMLHMWRNSWTALDNSTSASYANPSHNYRSHKNFEHLFRRAVHYSNDKFEEIGKLKVHSVAELNYIGEKELKNIVTACGATSVFDLPGNAMHMWPRNYGLSVNLSVDIAICLPVGYKDCRTFTTKEERCFSFEQQICILILRDVLPLHDSKRGVELKAKWSKAPKRLLIYIPQSQIKSKSTWYSFGLGIGDEQEYLKTFQSTLKSKYKLLNEWDVRFIVYTDGYSHGFPADVVTSTIIDSRFLAQRQHKGCVTCGAYFTISGNEVYPRVVHFDGHWATAKKI